MKAGAQLLFVALGSPLQEEWISKNRGRLNVSFLMGIGGTLDVVSGRSRWAPKFSRNAGLEWLYRLACKPSRLRRQIVLPLFLLKVLKARMRRRTEGRMTGDGGRKAEDGGLALPLIQRNPLAGTLHHVSKLTPYFFTCLN